MAKNRLYATARLKELRESSGYTQQEAADLYTIFSGFDTSASLYQKWELKTEPLDAEKALELARFYKVNVLDVVERPNNG